MNFTMFPHLQINEGQSERKRRLGVASQHYLSPPPNESCFSPPNKLAKSDAINSVLETNYNQSAHDNSEHMDMDCSEVEENLPPSERVPPIPLGISISHNTLPHISTRSAPHSSGHTSTHTFPHLPDQTPVHTSMSIYHHTSRNFPPHTSASCTSAAAKSSSHCSRSPYLLHPRMSSGAQAVTGFLSNIGSTSTAVGDGLRQSNTTCRRIHECVAIISDVPGDLSKSVVCKVKCPLSHSLEQSYPPAPNTKKTPVSTGRNCLDTSIRDLAGHGVNCVEHLYKGLHSNIFVGYQENKHRYVAVKLTNTGDHVCKRELRSRGPCLEARHDMKEIEYLRQLQHPNVVSIFDVLDTSSGKTAIMLEFCANGRLSRILEKMKLMPEKVAVRYFRQMLSAISFIHQEGYAVRNISLSHFLLSNSNQIKLVDLSEVISMGLVPTYNSVGITGFQAPESLSYQNQTYDAGKADIWSLGACLYSMITGTLTSAHHSLAKNYTSAFIFPRSMSHLLKSSIHSLLAGMLSFAPDSRYTMERIQNSDWLAQTSDALITGCYLLRQTHKPKISTPEQRSRAFMDI